MADRTKEMALRARRKQRAGQQPSPEEAEALRRYYLPYGRKAIKLYLQDTTERQRFEEAARQEGKSLPVWIRDMVYYALTGRQVVQKATVEHEIELRRRQVELDIARMETATAEARLEVYEAALKRAGLLTRALSLKAQRQAHAVAEAHLRRAPRPAGAEEPSRRTQSEPPI